MAPPSAPESVVVHPLVLLSVQDHYNRVAKDTRKRVVGVLLGESYKGRVDCTNSFAGALSLWAAMAACLQQPDWSSAHCTVQKLDRATGAVSASRPPPRLTRAAPTPAPAPLAPVPFEEDERDPSIWFLDHSYLENMFRMFKKVNGEGGRRQGCRRWRWPSGAAGAGPEGPPAVCASRVANCACSAPACPLTMYRLRLPFLPWSAARERIVGWYHTGPRLREADLDIQALMGAYCEHPLLLICEARAARGAGAGACEQKRGGV